MGFMTTALELITSSARLLGAVRKNEALAADEAQDALDALNDLFDSWSNDRLMITSITTESFALTGAASYTIGTGQTFSTTRPMQISSSFVRSGGLDYPLTIITDKEYFLGITLKDVAGSEPQFLYYDNAYPTGTIYLYPKGTGTLNIQSEKPLSNIAALSTTVNLAPGWKRLIRYNLALEISPEYDLPIPPAVVKIAGESMAAAKRSVAKSIKMNYEPAPSQQQNIYTGYYS